MNFNNPRGKPVLTMAVDNGMTGIVKYLLEVGADPNIHDRVITFVTVLVSALVILMFCRLQCYGPMCILWQGSIIMKP